MVIDVGSELVPAALGAVLAVGFGVFALACRLSAGEPLPPAHARRIARWRLAAPWVLGASAAAVLVDLGWVLLTG
ncbi:hypothetical protein ABZ816_30385 [Actinosynnema sp. NPDC047251]|uniref:hypothetical protein n=1 Tax=Saccharothrix espanaensis TaxID=103731 RepID=UPI0002FBF0CC|nr:hypothetical protein [Saccharothrix espanaensis]